MPFERPTLVQIEARVRGDLRAHLPQAEPELRRGNLGVLAKVEAGAVHGLYGYAERLSKQILPDTAEAEWLERHAGIWGVWRKPAAKASGLATFSGTDGSVVPAGAELRRADDVRYLTTETVAVSGGAASVTVEARVAGQLGNAEAGVGLAVISYVPGVAAKAVVASGGLGSGADRESDAALRARVLARIQAPPHGGSAADYEAWALEVPGVTRAWVYPGDGDGTVRVLFVRDGDADLIPDAGEVATVQAYLEPLRPVTAQVIAAAPAALPLDFTLSVSPDTSEVRAAVEAALADLIAREAEPEGTLLLSHIREAISQAAGEIDHTLTSPAADVTAGAGELLVMGTVTWS